MTVEKGKKIKMEYELAIDGGDLIESSASRGPIEYIHGGGMMLPGLESRIEGLTVGDEKEGVIPAVEAYGTEDTLPTKTMTRNEFPAGAEISDGQVFEAKDPNGNPVKFHVVSVDGDEITVRFDHPLAGKDIRFKVKILNISEGD